VLLAWARLIPVNRRQLFSLLLAAALLVGSIAAYAGRDHHDAPSDGTIETQPIASPPKSVPIDARRAFPILRHPGQPPPANIRKLARSVPGTNRLEVTRLHEASTRIGKMWVSFASGNLCIFAGRPPAISCSPIQLAEKAGVMLGLIEHQKSAPGPLSARRFIVYGVMPDSMSHLTLEIGHRPARLKLGRTRVFGLRASQPIRASDQ
jgi:hypothetical protein